MNNNDIKTVILTIIGAGTTQARRHQPPAGAGTPQRQDAFERGDGKALQAYTNNTTDHG